jgi:hypothetical protein
VKRDVQDKFQGRISVKIVMKKLLRKKILEMTPWSRMNTVLLSKTKPYSFTIPFIRNEWYKTISHLRTHDYCFKIPMKVGVMRAKNGGFVLS